MNTENSQEQKPDDGPVAYKDMSWQKLKALMTAEGQEWVNAEHAIEYLNKLDEADDSQDSDEADESSDSEKSAEEDPAPDGADEPTDTDADEDADITDTVDTDADADVVGNDDLVDSPVDDAPCFNPDDKHGVISGQCNARYWQDGCHFDSQGQYIAPEDVVIESEETD